MSAPEISLQQGKLLAGCFGRHDCAHDVGVHALHAPHRTARLEFVRHHAHRDAGRAAVASRAIGDHLAAPETRMGQRVVQWRGMGTHQAGEHFALDLARQIWTRPARRQKKLWQPRKVMLGQSPRLSRPALVGTTQSTRPRIMTGIYQWRQVKSVPRLVLPEENSVSRVWRLDALGRAWNRVLTPQRRNRARLQVIAKTC